MLRQQRIEQGKIGFEFAKAGSIDQWRQLVVSMRFAVGRELEITSYRPLHPIKKGNL
jgi:hypothetical protein